MNILVTGGSGFLGKHLCRALKAEGHQVKNIDLVDNPEFPAVKIDIRDLNALTPELANIDAVFHLALLIQAGESVHKPQLYVDVNITGSLNVLEAMRVNGVSKLLFSSSAAIYGEPLHTPIKENDRTIPINPYGVTKLTMEGLLSSYVQAHGFTGVALRYFNLYGPEEHHEPETHAIPRFIHQIKNNLPVTIWGSGKHQRDYIHIDDIVAAHLGALDLANREPGKYHYFNLSTNTPTEVLSVIKMIGEILGKEPLLQHNPERLGDPLVLTADATKANNQLGWKAKVSLRQGLEETIRYFEEHPSHIE